MKENSKSMELLVERNRNAAAISFLIGLSINLFGLGIAIGILSMS
jgi:hypothetical protein